MSQLETEVDSGQCQYFFWGRHCKRMNFQLSHLVPFNFQCHFDSVSWIKPNLQRSSDLGRLCKQPLWLIINGATCRLGGFIVQTINCYQAGAWNAVKFKALAAGLFITEGFPLFSTYQVNFRLPGNPTPLNWGWGGGRGGGSNKKHHCVQTHNPCRGSRLRAKIRKWRAALLQVVTRGLNIWSPGLTQLAYFGERLRRGNIRYNETFTGRPSFQPCSAHSD